MEQLFWVHCCKKYQLAVQDCMIRRGYPLYRTTEHIVYVYGERVLFIGTQFSNLYTAVDTPARGRVGVCVVFVCKYVLGHSRVSQPLNLRLCLLRHFGFLTSPHASPTCRRRRLTSYRLLRRSTPGPPPNLRAHLFHLPASPRPPLYSPAITN
jgi:hypothetical protein